MSRVSESKVIKNETHKTSIDGFDVSLRTTKQNGQITGFISVSEQNMSLYMERINLTPAQAEALVEELQWAITTWNNTRKGFTVKGDS